MFAATPNQKEFQYQKQLAKDILKGFTVGPDLTKVGGLLYGKRTRSIFTFDRNDDIDSVKKSIDQMTNFYSSQMIPSKDMQTYVTAAIKEALKVIREPNLGARPGEAKSLVIFTPENVVLSEKIKEELSSVQYYLKNIGDLTDADNKEDTLKEIINQITPGNRKNNVNHY